MNNPGYIYVLINYSMENLVKVGKTTRDVEERAKELSSATGVPTPFIVAFDTFFDDCSMAEDYVHKRLEQKGYRLSNNKEFFQAPLKEVISAILEVQQVLKSQETLYTKAEDQSVNPSGELSENIQKEHEKPWSAIEALADYHYYYGNYEEAYRFYQQALTLGSKDSYYRLGFMILRGQGCFLENEKEALDFLKKGADNGDGRCYGELAYHHLCCKWLEYATIEDYKVGKENFEKYLESRYVQRTDHPRIFYIFHCCVALDFFIYYYEAHEGIIKNLPEKPASLEDFLLRYKHILSPLKDEIIKFAIQEIKVAVESKYSLEDTYRNAARAIKNFL